MRGSISIENCFKPCILPLSGTAQCLLPRPPEKDSCSSMQIQSLVSGMDHHQGAKESCPSWLETSPTFAAHCIDAKVEAEVEIPSTVSY